jgi:hypothetical protein
MTDPGMFYAHGWLLPLVLVGVFASVIAVGVLLGKCWVDTDRRDDPCLSSGGHYVHGTIDTTTPDGRPAHVEERWCVLPDGGAR